MNQPAMLTREAALRIGLAARELPELGVQGLLEVLLEQFGAPLSEDTLNGLKVKNLKTSSALAATPVEALKLVAACLRGEGVEDPAQPPLEAYAEGDMPGSVRVACASNGGDRVDGHFGSCTRFLVYQVLPGERRLIDVRRTAVPDGVEVDDKNAYRADLIGDCHVLYLASIGGPAAAKVIKTGLYPIKLREPGAADDVLGELQRIMADAPPPWLAKVMGVPPEQRVRFEAEAEEA
ncbi:MAG: dinitrogenase iron-molybdenum cofactor biosynthesis protein [Acidihalobacter sp.]